MPDPTVPINETLKSDGLYKTIDTKKKFSYSSREWKNKYPIEFINNVITGDLLHISTLGTYSQKYKTMVDTRFFAKIVIKYTKVLASFSYMVFLVWFY